MRSINAEAPARARATAPTMAVAHASAGSTAFGPPLLRLLAQWAGAAPGPGRPSTTPTTPSGGPAERLADWLAWTDAIALSAALNQPQTPAPAIAAPVAAAPLADALHKLQATQARLIADTVRTQAASADADTDFAPCRRACQARQRAMAAAVGALRSRLRDALAASSPALAQLSALDAVLDTALAERERHLLGGVVDRIEARYLQARRQATPGWLAAFHHDLQAALLAELDLRLQPARGLLDALQAARQPAAQSAGPGATASAAATAAAAAPHRASA